jgi:hypothetical protein
MHETQEILRHFLLSLPTGPGRRCATCLCISARSAQVLRYRADPYNEQLAPVHARCSWGMPPNALDPSPHRERDAGQTRAHLGRLIRLLAHCSVQEVRIAERILQGSLAEARRTPGRWLFCVASRKPRGAGGLLPRSHSSGERDCATTLLRVVRYDAPTVRHSPAQIFRSGSLAERESPEGEYGSIYHVVPRRHPRTPSEERATDAGAWGNSASEPLQRWRHSR